mgnify:CR=1 FL=1
MAGARVSDVLMCFSMHVTFRQEPYFVVLLFLAGTLLALANANGLMLYSLDEVKNATCAREMWHSGEGIVPTFNQTLRTDKPPLHYYFMVFAYSLLGPTAFAARLFSAVMSGATIVITYLFGKRYLGRTPALWAVVALLGSIHWAVQFHMSVPDPYLIFFMVAALFAFYHGLHSGKAFYLFWMYAALALATLAKGPIGLALPGLIMLLYMIFTRRLRWSVLRQLHIPPGVLFYLGVVLPWYVLVHLKTGGEWTEGFFLKHNLGRFTDTMEGHGGIFLVTFAFVLGGMLPFSIFIPQTVVYLFKLARGKGPFDGACRSRSAIDALIFVGTGAAAIVLFFAVSQTKLPNYTVPAYPLLALGVGAFLNDTIQAGEMRRLRPALWAYAGLMVLFPVAGYIGLGLDPTVHDLQAHALWLIWLPLTGALALWLFYRRNAETSFGALAAGNVLFILLFFYVVYPPIDQRNPVAQSMEYLHQDQYPVVIYKRLNPAYIFHRGHPVAKYESMEVLRKQVIARPCYILTRNRYVDQLLAGLPQAQVVFKQRDTFERSTSVILFAGDTTSSLQSKAAQE